MRKILFLVITTTCVAHLFAQSDVEAEKKLGAANKPTFTAVKKNAATPVKSQAATGTCWSFSTTSLVESQALKNNLGEFDLSEMFTVRNIYIEKAKNYVLRQGFARFSEGGLGHDQINAIAKYGTMPESVYSGLLPGKKMHDHQKLVVALKNYLDSIIKVIPIKQNWMTGFTNLLDAVLGKPPVEFNFRGQQYSPLEFAKNVLKFNADDYVALTSFTHHPYYRPFILEVPDNYSNGAYMNIPVDEMMQLTKEALNKGYTVMWDADVSNIGFSQNEGIAALYDTSINSFKKMNLRKIREEAERRQQNMRSAEASKAEAIKASESGNYVQHTTEKKIEVLWDAELRQTLFESLVTQDDHLMHITGIERSTNGTDFFMVKNSWGNVGPENGYIHVSESYFGINTISIIVPKAALSKTMLEKLEIN